MGFGLEQSDHRGACNPLVTEQFLLCLSSVQDRMTDKARGHSTVRELQQCRQMLKQFAPRTEQEALNSMKLGTIFLEAERLTPDGSVEGPNEQEGI